MNVALAYGKASKPRRIASLWDSFVACGRVLKGALDIESFWSLTEHDLTGLSDACDRLLKEERRQNEAARKG